MRSKSRGALCTIKYNHMVVPPGCQWRSGVRAQAARVSCGNAMRAFSGVKTRKRPGLQFALNRGRARLSAMPLLPGFDTPALSGKVSWDCLSSYLGSRHSVPAAPTLASWCGYSHHRGGQLLVLDARRDAEHPLTAAKGTIVMRPEHYTQLCRGTNVRRAARAVPEGFWCASTPPERSRPNGARRSRSRGRLYSLFSISCDS